MSKPYSFLLPAGVAVALAVPAALNASLHTRNNANLLDNERTRAVSAINARMDKGQPARFVNPRQASQFDNQYTPSTKIEQAQAYGDLDGPNGTIWYFTTELEYKDIPVNEYWTDHILQSYTFNIYNEKMEKVGTIHDRINYKEHEVRTVVCDLAPIVTKNFFNGDDKYEVMVGLIVNTDYYVNQNYNLVYSLGGEKVEGCDKVVYETHDQLGDVLDASEGGEENYYMVFARGGNSYVPEDASDTMDNLDRNYWGKYTGNYSEYEIYGKAAPGTVGMTSIYKRRMPTIQAPGDQQDTPVMISYMHNGKATYMFQQYDEPFYNRFDSYQDDMTQRDGNKLTIELIEVEGTTAKTVQTTKIDVVHDTSDDRVAGSYYSTGMLRYRYDIDYTNYSTDGRACFIITRQNYVAGQDKYVPSYYVYNADGQKIGTIFENADPQGVMALSDVPGHNPQYMFVTVDNVTGDYIFNFVDIKDLKTLFSISSKLVVEDSDPDQMTANLDRVPVGDSYKYIVEMRVPALDENENNLMRVAWLNADGSFDRMDEINMGQMVNYAQLFIATGCMHPTYFHSDAKQEYMLLIKRATGANKLQEELMIAQPCDIDQPAGKTILQLGPDSELGALSTIMTFNGDHGNRLMVSYVGDDGKFSQHFYNLPLDAPATGAVTDIVGEADSNAPAEFFNLQGIRVANPVPGNLYIKRQGRSTTKVIL